MMHRFRVATLGSLGKLEQLVQLPFEFCLDQS